MSKLVSLATASFAATGIFWASNAAADWDVQNSGKDVFGNVNVTATSLGENGNILRFECGSSSEPFLAFLVRDGSGSIQDFPATFFHVDKSEARHAADAVLTSWNEKFIAVRLVEQEALKRLADHMLTANKAIPVGIEVGSIGVRISDTFSSRGSTAAAKVILENCIRTTATDSVQSQPGTETKTVAYYYGYADSVWEQCKAEELPNNSGHLLDLISVAIHSLHVPTYEASAMARFDSGSLDASRDISSTGCAGAATKAIDQLPAKY